VSEIGLRILVFDLPPLLCDLVQRGLEAHAGVTSFAGTTDLRDAVDSTRPDAVIVRADDGVPTPEARRWLDDRARPPLLGLGVRDGRAVLYELEPRRTELGAVAPNDLAGLIRASLDGKVGV
jgi:hypothetical protein